MTSDSHNIYQVPRSISLDIPIRVAIGGVTYSWFGGIGAILTSRERGVRRGDVIALMTSKSRDIQKNKSIKCGKMYEKNKTARFLKKASRGYQPNGHSKRADGTRMSGCLRMILPKADPSSLALQQLPRMLILAGKINPGIQAWVQLLESDVHERQEVQAGECARHGLEGLLFRRVVDVEAVPSEDGDFISHRADLIGIRLKVPEGAEEVHDRKHK